MNTNIRLIFASRLTCRGTSAGDIVEVAGLHKGPGVVLSALNPIGNPSS